MAAHPMSCEYKELENTPSSKVNDRIWDLCDKHAIELMEFQWFISQLVFSKHTKEDDNYYYEG